MIRRSSLIGGLLLGGCFGGEPPVPVPPLDPGESATQALADYDANHDGAIDATELEKCPGLKAALTKLDKDANGKLSDEEISARISQIKTIGLAFAPVTCQAKLDGRPLSGALVTLVPEKFMGPSVQPAQGTTDSQGLCMLQIEGAEFPGSRCGVFRIEVSKRDSAGRETIPARYNTGTTLGADVGPGGSLSEGSIVLSLKSR